MSTLLATAMVAKVWRRSWNVGRRPWVPPDVLPLVVMCIRAALGRALPVTTIGQTGSLIPP